MFNYPVIAGLVAVAVVVLWRRWIKGLHSVAGTRIVLMEAFSEASNFPVIRHPGRKFPGSLIQGDSLSYLYQLATSALSRARTTGDEELIEKAEELQEQLELRVALYEETLARFGMALPYPGPLVRKEAKPPDAEQKDRP